MATRRQMNDLPSWDWATLFGMFCRLHREYQADGDAGGKRWARAKMVLFVYSLQRPIRVGALLKELQVKTIAGVALVSEMLKEQVFLELGYEQGVTKENVDELRIVELAPKGIAEATSLIDAHKEAFLQEQKSIVGWRLYGWG